jgi:hypothetical protein
MTSWGADPIASHAPLAAIGRSLSQGIGASIQTVDRISVAHGFVPIITQLPNPRL